MLKTSIVCVRGHSLPFEIAATNRFRNISPLAADDEEKKNFFHMKTAQNRSRLSISIAFDTHSH